MVPAVTDISYRQWPQSQRVLRIDQASAPAHRGQTPIRRASAMPRGTQHRLLRCKSVAPTRAVSRGESQLLHQQCHAPALGLVPAEDQNQAWFKIAGADYYTCLLYTSPSP